MSGTARVDEALVNLVETYNELNADYVDVLDKEPSPLEFMRSYVARNRPFVLRGGARSWTASKKWNAAYLRETMADNDVNVAVTPYGNADAVIQDDSTGHKLYVEPLEQQESFPLALDYIRHDSSSTALSSDRPVKYLQTQNDNLRTEYLSLYADVPAKIHFASIALDSEPDAINFWLGNARSVTSMHRDNYENVYAQIRGKKHFVLLPPIASSFVRERYLPRARYERGCDGELRHRVVEPREEVPVPTWDPNGVDADGDRRVDLKPLRVTLEEGDMFYLPAMWYHEVSQSCGDEGFCCSVNYW